MVEGQDCVHDLLRRACLAGVAPGAVAGWGSPPAAYDLVAEGWAALFPTKIRAEQSTWLGLEIVDTEAGGMDDENGVVEFIARFTEKGQPKQHHERSRFSKHAGRWYYLDGEVPKPQTQRHEGPKVGRNDPCPCGSGKKYKKCCGK